MKPEKIIAKLEENSTVIEKLCENLTEAEYSWKADHKQWSILEIICHLRDEEIEDFRTRIRCLIANPPKQPPSFNPEVWVLERKYNEQSFEDKLASFLREREGSVLWLHSLDSDDWTKSWEQANLGLVTPLFYLHNWLVHDYLHIRQIIKVKYDYLTETGDTDLSYAGTWK